ncbi:alpha-tocopherol transfer protein-like [Hermetia illucens]|uniref:alpha-tocopherol transfer protein-like n=1 Tax=Hermetia illucens TaxID=343691 RepID=UPI0018CBF771|nr:alpha-tocopherol transfer protein-like [Hermetia illucens]
MIASKVLPQHATFAAEWSLGLAVMNLVVLVQFVSWSLARFWTKMRDLDLGFDLDEALERTKISKADIELLRGRLPEDVPNNLTDKQLLLFLNACGSIDEALKVIKIYYDARRNAPEHFNNRDPKHPKIKQCFENQTYYHVPPTEKDDCPIVYHKIMNPKASTYFFDNALKTYCMTMDVALYKYGPRPGVIFVHDMENVGFTHILRASISSIRKYLHYLQYGVPAKLCRVHVLNVVPLFDKILTLVKPFLKKELLEIIHVHPANMNYEDFHRDWIPKSHMPVEYGGDLKSMKELNESFYEEILSLRDHFLAEENQRDCI